MQFPRWAKEKEAAAAKVDRAKATKGRKKGPAKKAVEKAAEKETVGDGAASTNAAKVKAGGKGDIQEGAVGGSARAARSNRGISAA